MAFTNLRFGPGCCFSKKELREGDWKVPFPVDYLGKVIRKPRIQRVICGLAVDVGQPLLRRTFAI
ncbi:MAG: hypothetical protein CM1200mP30_29730 [Pseudomonadota bacterium]|nr:MAG: hypothetical protein CM1200mP30_29730 [Pseudomonadota bacterium]